jgi:hypothetical protein
MNTRSSVFVRDNEGEVNAHHTVFSVFELDENPSAPPLKRVTSALRDNSYPLFEDIIVPLIRPAKSIDPLPDAYVPVPIATLFVPLAVAPAPTAIAPVPIPDNPAVAIAPTATVFADDACAFAPITVQFPILSATFAANPTAVLDPPPVYNDDAVNAP